MLQTLHSSLTQMIELMDKYKDGKSLEEIEVSLLAKSNIRALKEAIREQIAFDKYWEENYSNIERGGISRRIQDEIEELEKLKN